MDVGNISLYIPYCDLNTAVAQTYPRPPIYTFLYICQETPLYLIYP